ncbi:Ferric/cupric reductase transmembrane component 2 [Pleurostoma richardsiae]|uniref:Ferric/cupric reductase transmembrane component 2 n=1 Tax=Pleurostoma richardsiae TaxID=41990 RepID=A0AA38S103_9PEZI|nr:Ferric/cupric reductase transmembrane component 2 [Pleurostoma richardsiae]
MGWPYHFLDLSHEEKHERRLTLDRYAGYAQLSAFLPALIFLIYRFACWVSKAVGARRRSYDVIPDSPSLKVKRQSSSGAWATQIRILRWWLEDDVVAFGQAWGTRDVWIVGAAWSIWLLVLCVVGTGNDYLHLTKRFGIIAASQFPVQYLLSLKSINPFAFAFRSSHEQMNRWHRLLGRIVYGLLILHAIFYVNYFIQVGILRRRLFAPVVAAGVLSLIGMTLMYTTALHWIRHYSYRIFFITHLVVAMCLPPFLFFHAKSANIYMAEAFLAFIADLAWRKIDTVAALATVESIPGTNLIKISASIPYSKVNRFREHPGSHIYLSIPAAARPSSNPASISFLLFEFLYNPFTVAAVDEETGDLTLVARHRSGPVTAALARFAGIHPATAPSGTIVSHEEGKIPLGIEGPYGAVDHFRRLSGGDYDRVLLVAGGVGATFTVPLYRALLHDNPTTRVEMAWAVRGAGDATWAVAGRDGKGIIDDNNVHIFLTGDILASDGGGSAATAAAGTPPPSGGESRDGEVEMSTMYRDRQQGGRYTSRHNRRRPDLKKVVDDAFRHGSEERVAVLVCGPEEMGREVRGHVGAWVRKGRVVWWHNEAFGW